MRQYKIFYQRLGSRGFAPLQPNLHANLYDRPEVQQAINHMLNTPCVEGMAIRLGEEQFNVIALDQEELATNAFAFQREGR